VYIVKDKQHLLKLPIEILAFISDFLSISECQELFSYSIIQGESQLAKFFASSRRVAINRPLANGLLPIEIACERMNLRTIIALSENGCCLHGNKFSPWLWSASDKNLMIFEIFLNRLLRLDREDEEYQKSLESDMGEAPTLVRSTSNETINAPTTTSCRFEKALYDMKYETHPNFSNYQKSLCSCCVSQKYKIAKQVEERKAAARQMRNKWSKTLVYSRDDQLTTNNVTCAIEDEDNTIVVGSQYRGRINTMDKRGVTVLRHAVEGRHLKIIRRLLQIKGDFLDVDLEFEDGWKDGGHTALSIAASRGYLDIVKLLVEKGHADINKESTHGLTALISAISGKHMDVIEYLIDQPNCRIHQECVNGATAIRKAIIMNEKDIVSLLIQKSDRLPPLYNFQGDNIYRLAGRWADEDVLNILKGRQKGVEAEEKKECPAQTITIDGFDPRGNPGAIMRNVNEFECSCGRAFQCSREFNQHHCLLRAYSKKREYATSTVK
jgi:hypothetical protein